HGTPGNPTDLSVADELTGTTSAVTPSLHDALPVSTASADIGGNIRFLDDGPSAAIAATAVTVSVDETIAGTQGDETTSAGVISLFVGVANQGSDLSPAQYATKAGLVTTAGSSVGSD